MHWVCGLPWGVVHAHLEAIPALQAEESLIEAERIAMGTGSLKKSDAARVRKRWERAMSGPTRRADRVKAPVNPGALAALGIKVEGK